MTGVSRFVAVLGMTVALVACGNDHEPEAAAPAEAEVFVRAAGPKTGPLGPEAVDVEGYHCVATRIVADPLPNASYECTNGPRTVTFVRT
ncbi:MAG: hypothetical protein QOJ69_76 [Actinomycetota bacterium]|nr:hypothetical protein [Actinomycetota bacterium]